MKYLIVSITLIVAILITGAIVTPRNMDIYTMKDCYHVNLRTLHITSELGTDQHFGGHHALTAWIDSTTAADADINDPYLEDWIISNYITVVVGDTITVNLGGYEMNLPYQETDPRGNKYYYIID